MHNGIFLGQHQFGASPVGAAIWRSRPVWKAFSNHRSFSTSNSTRRSLLLQCKVEQVESVVAIPQDVQSQTKNGSNGHVSSTNTHNGVSQAPDRKTRKDTYFVTFRWPAALKGEDVCVIGSFTDWEVPIPLGKSAETGDFVRTVALPTGTYQYKYLVDGEWLTSPCEEVNCDDQGNMNNQRHVSSTVQFTWKEEWGGEEVFVIGDFTAWGELLPMAYDASTREYVLECSLPPGDYAYQLLVDGEWKVSPEVELSPDEGGHMCNKVHIGTPPAFHIFYATGWEDTKLLVRNVTASGKPLNEEWREVPMYSTRSRAKPSGGRWKTVVVPVPQTSTTEYPALQFVVTNGKGRQDAPTDAEAYYCHHPGGYKLHNGLLTPYAPATSLPFMVVSDLDGTMVDDSADGFTAMQEFTRYWEDNAVLRGGILVYNTGRSIGQFASLYEEKQGHLALPDVVITAVGTKVFLLDTTKKSRRDCDGRLWQEDADWAAHLDEGWNLDKVRKVATGVINQNEHGAFWLDQGTEHPHRIALSVNTHVLNNVLHKLKEGFKKEGVQVQIITSGMGEWRYVDCVAINGGKLAALEYVRSLYKIPKERCVAAGDSGNDKLMLNGDNPAIIVGNAQPELVSWLSKQPQNGRIVFSDGFFARGILEGLARHGLY